MDYIKSFCYGGIFGTIAGASLIEGFKYSIKARSMNDQQKKAEYETKGKLFKITAWLAALIGVCGGLGEDNFGSMPFDAMISGDTIGVMLGMYLTLKKN